MRGFPRERQTTFCSAALIRRAAAGFTFTEILFAVMILAIGFIMVAAMFPVGIKQTQESVEEVTAANICQEGANFLAQVGSDANFPVTASAGTIGIMSPTAGGGSNSFWPLVAGGMILPTDSRFAWVPLYSRGRQPVATANPPGATSAQVILIAVKATDSATFSTADLKPINNFANLEAKPVDAVFTAGGTSLNPDSVVLSNAAGGTFVGAATEGAYLVVADDSPSITGAHTVSANGFVLRLGNAGTQTNQWQLAPGGDMKSLSANSKPIGGTVHCLIVGQSYADSTGTTFSGGNMTLGAFSTFIKTN